MNAPEDSSPFFILKDKHALRVSSFQEWSPWMATHDNTVAVTECQGVVISTVFLGLAHNFWGRQDPLLFETMVFTEGESGRMNRYCTWDEAEAGHAKFVAALKAQQASAECLTLEALTRLAHHQA